MAWRSEGALARDSKRFHRILVETRINGSLDHLPEQGRRVAVGRHGPALLGSPVRARAAAREGLLYDWYDAGGVEKVDGWLLARGGAPAEVRGA